MKIEIEPRIVHRGYDQRSCWVHARCGFVYEDSGKSKIVLTLQKSQMGTSDAIWDVFSVLSMMLSEDEGRTWTGPTEQKGLNSWSEPGGVNVVISDFTPQWHRASKTLLGIGHNCRYLDGKLMPSPRPRQTVYATFDAAERKWRDRQILTMPDVDRFFSCGAGSIQWEELPNGEILLPVYFHSFSEALDAVQAGTAQKSRVVVLRCAFDGEALKLMEIGEELQLDVRRGLCEPSLIAWRGQYWMTLRSGDRAYYARSHDGLNFDEPKAWCFDDGVELGSYDTQQHWAQVGERLFLVYTRRGLNNDHVVRHRAPLVMAEVDAERGCVLRGSEQIVVPNRGAQLGNFGVAMDETGSAVVCVSEWMENAGSWNGEVWSALGEKFPDSDLEALEATPGRSGLCAIGGSDNSIHLVRMNEAHSRRLHAVGALAEGAQETNQSSSGFVVPNCNHKKQVAPIRILPNNAQS